MIQNVPIDDLHLLERNPRTITEKQFKKLCKSLQTDPDFLQCRPILVNRVNDTLTIYAGNQRYRAAKYLNWTHVPCIIEDNLCPNIIKERIIKDNKSTGEFDFDILSSDYDVDELLDLGFTEFELGLDISSPHENIPKKDKKKKTCPNCGEIL
jgi:ParB-like chromosome segregation protein Spo0J